MILYKVKHLIEATRGTLLWGSPEMEFDSLCTDTRALQAGQVFWALRGPNFNANAFVARAIQEGARGAVFSERMDDCTPPENTFGLLVPDAQMALGAFANYHRLGLKPCVITTSGSSGKTTTKDMIRAILGVDHSVLATKGNRNNLIGLPLTLLDLEPAHEYCVAEMGMNEPGELLRLTQIAQPNVAVLTCITDGHIGKFGSLKKLIAAKAELLEGLPRECLLIINADCQNSARALEMSRKPLQLITFGVKNPSDIMAEETLRLEPFGYRFRAVAREQEAWVELRLFGRFQIYNALAALSVAMALGMDLATAARALSDFQPAALRTEILDLRGVRLIVDCYNSIPSATMESLASLRDLSPAQGKGRLVALLADMAELGDFEEPLHRMVGERVVNMSLDLVVTVGERARTIHNVVNAAGLPCRHCATPVEAGQYLAQTLRPNDTVLVKGSRIMRLEEAVETLKRGLAAAV